MSSLNLFVSSNACNSSAPYTDIWRRNWEYKLGVGETSVNDFYIDNSLEQWYGMVGVDLWMSPPGLDFCGCNYPVWMRNHTDDTAEMCVQTPEDDCFMTWNIEMTDCGNMYVYKLVKTPFPDTAYCTGMTEENPVAPPEVTITPRIMADYEANASNIVVFCDFSSITHPQLYYQTQWFVNNKHIWTTPIHNWSPNYRHDTRLYQAKLQEGGITKMGFDIRCEVVTRSSEFGSPVSTITSPTRFLGITTDTWSITVSNDEVKEIYLLSTAPIGCRPDARGTCSLSVIVKSWNESDGVELTSSGNPKAYSVKTCAVTLTSPSSSPPSGEWSVTSSSLKIRGEVIQSKYTRTGITKFRLRTQIYHHMVFWRDVYVGELTVTVRSSPSIADGKKCKVYLDPHMLTFDGRFYEHQFVGLYTVYKHTGLPVEIQMRFQRCSGRPTATCGHALAVRSGRSVFRFYRGSVSRPWQIGYASYEQGALTVKMKGHEYMISLPTGAYIKVHTSSSRVDAYIYPSAEDVNSTAGLCGTLTGSCSDDFILRNGSMDPSSSARIPCSSQDRWPTFQAFSESWRVRAGEDLFLDANINALAAWNKSYRYCTCERGGYNNSQVACTTGVSTAKIMTLISGYKNVLETLHIFPNLAVHSINRRAAPFGDQPKAKDNSWDEARATEYCNLLFNRSSAIKACSGMKDTDLQNNIDFCIFDVQQMQSPDIGLAAVEASKTTCLFEAMMDSDLQNETTPGVGTILDQVKAVICPNDCSGHGNCNNGSCNCDTHYGAVDCSVKLNDPPTIFGLNNDGYCDVSADSCKETSVMTEYVVDSDDVKCKLQPFTIDINNVESTEDPVSVSATVESFSEAVCTLPQTRDVRSTPDSPSSAVGHGYRVSIANDGVTYSTSSIFIVYNSECQKCEIMGNVVKCEVLNDACISNGACVKPGELHPSIPCYKCDEKNPGTWTRARGPECSSKQTDSQSLLWLIGAVVGGVVLCVIVLVVACIIRQKRLSKMFRLPRFSLSR